MNAIAWLSRHAWTVVGLVLMAVVPFWVVHEGRKFEEQQLEKDLVWVEWYPGVLELSRQRGKIVWLHFESGWDIWGMINRERILRDPEIVKELKRQDVVLVSVDCTTPRPEITAEMERLGRSHLPFSAIAPKDASVPLIALPDLVEPDDFSEALRIAASY